MKRNIGILFLLLAGVSAKLSAQEIAFEQRALDYFADSILNKQYPFLQMEAHFSGAVDSAITRIQPEQIVYTRDTALFSAYMNGALNKNGKQPPFLLRIKSPIKEKNQKKYKPGNNVVRLNIYQNHYAMGKNFMHIRGFIKDGNEGYDIYFTIDNEGNIIHWNYGHFSL